MHFLPRLQRRQAILLAFCQLAFFCCQCQLRANDILPDLSVNTVMNYKSTKLSFSNFDGKAIIIDFWDTRCHSCLEGLVNIDTLQRKFKNDIQFVLVTKQKRSTVNEFFKQFRNLRLPEVPIITDDNKISALFPTDGYPYIVWINKGRVVKYFTGGYNLTEKHFEDFVKGKDLSMKAEAKAVSYIPIWQVKETDFLSNVQYYSSITSCIDGVNMQLPKNTVVNGGKSIQLSSNCRTLLDLIIRAYGEDNKYAINTYYGLRLKIDSGLLFRPADPNQWDDWNSKHLFNYQLIIPAQKKEMLYKIMQGDLERFFSISVAFERQKVNGFVLTSSDPSTIPSSKYENAFDAYANSGLEVADTLHFYNQPFDRLIKLLGFWIHSTHPFKSIIAEKKNIDFSIRRESIEPLNIFKLNQDLKPLNIKLEERPIETDVLIVD